MHRKVLTGSTKRAVAPGNSVAAPFTSGAHRAAVSIDGHRGMERFDVRSWKKLLALASVVEVFPAAAVILALPRASIAQDTIVIAVLTIVLASLVGSYALRQHARRTLIYDRATLPSDSDDAVSDPPPGVSAAYAELSRRVWW